MSILIKPPAHPPTNLPDSEVLAVSTSPVASRGIDASKFDAAAVLVSVVRNSGTDSLEVFLEEAPAGGNWKRLESLGSGATATYSAARNISARLIRVALVPSGGDSNFDVLIGITLRRLRPMFSQQVLDGAANYSINV